MTLGWKIEDRHATLTTPYVERFLIIQLRGDDDQGGWIESEIEISVNDLLRGMSE